MLWQSSIHLYHQFAEKDQITLLVNNLSNIQRRFSAYFSHILLKMKTGETNQIHFTKPVLPRYQSQPKTSSRKKESNRLIFLNRCEKILNKILEN